MRTILFFLAFSFFSFCLFFVGAAVICGTAQIQKMNFDVRQTVFGFWIATVTMGMIVHFVKKHS